MNLFSDAKMRTTYPDGRTQESSGGAGEAHWRNPLTHALENIGTTEAHSLAIDVKTALQGRLILIVRDAHGPTGKDVVHGAVFDPTLAGKETNQ